MLEFRILGPLEVLDKRTPVDVGGRQPRTLLAVLLAAGGRSVPVDALADAIWGEDRPASATGTLQSYVSRIRRRLGPDSPLVSDDVGYRLQVTPDQVDFRRFEALVAEGRSLLDGGRPEEARARLEEAEGLWRGRALAEFADLDFATGLATRLEQLRLGAIETRLAAQLRLGRHAAAVGELTELVAEHPLREGLQVQLALAPLPLRPPGRGAAGHRRRHPDPPGGARHRAQPGAARHRVRHPRSRPQPRPAGPARPARPAGARRLRRLRADQCGRHSRRRRRSQAPGPGGTGGGAQPGAGRPRRVGRRRPLRRPRRRAGYRQDPAGRRGAGGGRLARRDRGLGPQ